MGILKDFPLKDRKKWDEGKIEVGKKRGLHRKGSDFCLYIYRLF